MDFDAMVGRFLSATDQARNAFLDEMRGFQTENKKMLAEIERLRAALGPFAENVDATSLVQALGHISREHLLEARAALARSWTNKRR